MRRWGIGALVALATGGAVFSCQDGRALVDPTGEPTPAPGARWLDAPSRSIATHAQDGGAPLAWEGDGGAPDGPCREVRVLDPERRPVPDAIVLAGLLDATPRELIADGAGRTTLCLPLQEIVTVEAYDADGRWERVTGRWRDTRRTLTLVLMEPPEMAVRVVDEDGRPVRGARVALTSRRHADVLDAHAERIHRTLTGRAVPHTDARGEVTLSVGRVGLYHALVDHPDYLVGVSERVALRPGERVEVELSLQDAIRVCGTLELRGRPPAHGWVEMGGYSAQADQAGRFCFDERVPPGSHATFQWGADHAVAGWARREVAEELQLALEPAGSLRVEVDVDPRLARCDHAGGDLSVTSGAFNREAPLEDGGVVEAVPPGTVAVQAWMGGVRATRDVIVSADREARVRLELRVPSGWGVVWRDVADDWREVRIDGRRESLRGCLAVPAGEHAIEIDDAVTRVTVPPGGETRLPPPPPAPRPAPPVIRRDEIAVEPPCRPRVMLTYSETPHPDGDLMMISWVSRADTSLLPGDLLLAIDGEALTGERAMLALAGDEGTSVTLSVERDGRRFSERLIRDACAR